MPEIQISLSGLVKENQKDEKPAAEFSLSIKDSSVTEYDGAKKTVVAAKSSRTIDTSAVGSPRYLAVLLEAGDQVRLQLRQANTEANDLVIGQFFLAEVKNLEQIKLINESSEAVGARIFLVGGGS